MPEIVLIPAMKKQRIALEHSPGEMNHLDEIESAEVTFLKIVEGRIAETTLLTHPNGGKLRILDHFFDFHTEMA